MATIEPIPPEFSLDRVINETRQVAICPKCKSSMIRKYYLYIFGKKTCINKECNYEN
jgi:hypothetical protein